MLCRHPDKDDCQREVLPDFLESSSDLKRQKSSSRCGMQNYWLLSKHTSTLTIDICADLAQDVLGQHRCEWILPSKQICGKHLASHNLLVKHVQFHARITKREKNLYACAYGRCGHRTESQKDLWILHVLPHHLQRIELQCPVQSCPVKAASSARGLTMGQHFLNAHPDLLGREICFPCDFLRLSARPMHLAPNLHPPPILQGQPLVLSSLLLASVQPCTSPRTLALGSSASSSRNANGMLQATSQKPRRKQLDPTAEEPDLCTIEFDDFSCLQEDGGTFPFSSSSPAEEVLRQKLDPQRVLVTRKEPSRTEVSRPPVLAAPPKVIDPPPSILYEAWGIEVDKRLPPEPDSDDATPSSPDSDEDLDKDGLYAVHLTRHAAAAAAAAVPFISAASAAAPAVPAIASTSQHAAGDAASIPRADRGARKRTASSIPADYSARPAKSRRTSMQDISDLAADLTLDT